MMLKVLQEKPMYFLKKGEESKDYKLFVRSLTAEVCSNIYCALSVGITATQGSIFTYFSAYCISKWETIEVTLFSVTSCLMPFP